jgi:hypothetical protein
VQLEFGLHDLAVEDARNATSDPKLNYMATLFLLCCVLRR